MYDKEIDEMRQRMTAAAAADAKARSQGQPAMYKVQMLPEVVNLLNRNQIVNSLVDPELNLLEAVKFFLEPLEDGSLPAYSIQRDLFAALAKLPMNREALIASGIGKVVIFYTKSKRPQLAIKRQADRLLADWTRPLLNRTDDYTKKHFETAEYREEYVHPIPSNSHKYTNTNRNFKETAPLQTKSTPQPSRKKKSAPANFYRHASSIALASSQDEAITPLPRSRISRRIIPIRWFRVDRISGRGLIRRKRGRGLVLGIRVCLDVVLRGFGIFRSFFL